MEENPFKNYKHKSTKKLSHSHQLSSRTLVHRAKNKEMSLWASGNNIEVFRTNDFAPIVKLFPEDMGSETWEPLVDVSWLSTWKEIHKVWKKKKA